MTTARGNRGLYYCGATKLSVPALSPIEGWLSVDPMSSRDPALTSYHYVKNNPINLVDPTGLPLVIE